MFDERCKDDFNFFFFFLRGIIVSFAMEISKERFLIKSPVVGLFEQIRGKIDR